MANEQQSSESSGTSEKVVSVVVWLAIIAGGLWWYFHEPPGADVLLDVRTQPELVSGTVSFAGTPVASGTIHVVVTDAGTRRYLAGMTLSVGEKGTFSSQNSPKFAVEEYSHPQAPRSVRPLRVQATYYGNRLVSEKDKPPQTKVLEGDATLYINSSPPLGQAFLWSMGAVGIFLLVLQLWVFTGDLGQRKARTLFVLMYFFTFWALALPLVVSLIVAQNKYLVDSMENSPLGLVKAKTSALAETQWLINIGGTVKQPSVAQRVDDDVKRAATVAKANAVAAGSSEPPAAETVAVIEDPDVTIQGGVTVPFFMVLLAVFGAGINMTLKVPAIQRAYEDVLSRARSAPFNLFTPWRLWFPQAQTQQAELVNRETAGDIRRDLIENYMYLLSAPLLVIAMYYLLQVMAAQVTQPVLVLMALATGLVSKAVIGGIIDFAEQQLSTKRREGRAADDSNAAITAQIEEAKAKQLEAQASQQTLTEAREREVRARAFAEAAQAAERKAVAEMEKVQAAQATGEATPAEAAAAKARAEEAAREAAEKQAQADEASAQATTAEEESNVKGSQAEAAMRAAQKVLISMAEKKSEAIAEATREAVDKQSEARTAAETTEQAAKAAIVKQAEATEAMGAIVKPTSGAAPVLPTPMTPPRPSDASAPDAAAPAAVDPAAPPKPPPVP